MNVPPHPCLGPILNLVRLVYMRVSGCAQTHLSLSCRTSAKANQNRISRLCENELGLPHLGTGYTTHPGYARIAKQLRGLPPGIPSDVQETTSYRSTKCQSIGDTSESDVCGIIPVNSLAIYFANVYSTTSRPRVPLLRHNPGRSINL
jgi:hypothetical protein